MRADRSTPSRASCASTWSPTSPERAARHRPRAATRPRTIACAAAAEMTALRVPQRVGLVLSPDDGAAVAARVVVRFHLRAFARVEPAARAGEVEPVHQLRVATRRLRAALRLFAPVLPARFAAAAHRDLAWLATAIGAVRDLDVLGETLRKQAVRLDPELRRAAGPLGGAPHEQPEGTPAGAGSRVAGQRARRLLERLAVFADPRAPVGRGARPGDVAPRPLRPPGR